jgi:hypothetical protein
VGVVRDKDTGKPIPGAIVESYLLAGSNVAGRPLVRAVADKEGRYRLIGMPKAEGSQIRVSPPDGQPYLRKLATVSDGPGLAPVTVDVALRRGVWITGKVTDKATGLPVPSWIRYVVFPDNPNLPENPGVTFDDQLKNRPEDGTFRFVGLPGRAVVGARAWQPNYLTGMGAERIKGIETLWINMELHAVTEVNAEKGAESVACELILDPGRKLKGTIVGPDGKPLVGTFIRGLEHQEVWTNRPAAAEFSLLAPKPGEKRLLQVATADKKLAGSLVVSGDDKGPLTIKLGPAAVLTGRFVIIDGKPLADLEVLPMTQEPLADPRVRPQPDVTAGSFPRGPRTDKDGKFRIEGLTAGLTYRLAVRRGMYVLTPEGDAGKGATVKGGETTDLGEVKIRLIDE